MREAFLSIDGTRALLAAALILAGCSRSIPNDPNCMLIPSGGWGPAGTASVKVETVATGLEVPWSIAFLPSGDLLVTERPGRVSRVAKAGGTVTTVATIPAVAADEGGLLGLALHPAFSNNGLFYVYVTMSAGGSAQNRVERWKLAADEMSAAFDRVIVDGISAAQFHDGGRIHFGPDGMLYVGTGDARSPDSAQAMDSKNGKLLRMTPEGDVPADNPTVGSLVFLSGVRNLEAFDWIAPNEIVLADHGPSGELGRSGHDEVEIVRAGQNLGWPNIYSCEADSAFVSPALTTEDAMPPGGLALYTGTKIPEWKGSVLIGTLASRHLHRVAFDPSTARLTAHEVYFQGDPPAGFGRLRDVTMGPDGDLYVTTSNCDGRGTCPADKDRILRITR